MPDMKKFLSFSLLLLGVLCVVTSCNDKNRYESYGLSFDSQGYSINDIVPNITTGEWAHIQDARLLRHKSGTMYITLRSFRFKDDVLPISNAKGNRDVELNKIVTRLGGVGEASADTVLAGLRGNLTYGKCSVGENLGSEPEAFRLLVLEKDRTVWQLFINFAVGDTLRAAQAERIIESVQFNPRRFNKK